MINIRNYKYVIQYTMIGTHNTKNENFYTDYKNKDSITLYYAEFPQRS